MMFRIGDFLKNLKRVFSHAKYIVIALVIALLFFEFNVAVLNFALLREFFSRSFIDGLDILFQLSKGFYETIMIHSFISVVMISLLLGILVSLIYFKSDYNLGIDKKEGFFGGMGILLGALIPGCAACGISILGIFGLGAGFFALLPFEGFEISVLAILILLGVIYKTTLDVTSCNIQKLKGGILE